jgi:hypothetical protein
MNGQFLAFVVADLVGAAMVWLVTRAGRAYPWAWSLGAWAATAALCTGLIPVQTMILIAAVTMIVGVGMITPLVGVIAVLVLLATPIIVAHQLWGRWRRRAIAARVSRA